MCEGLLENDYYATSKHRKQRKNTLKKKSITQYQLVHSPKRKVLNEKLSKLLHAI